MRAFTDSTCRHPMGVISTISPSTSSIRSSSAKMPASPILRNSSTVKRCFATPASNTFSITSPPFGLSRPTPPFSPRGLRTAYAPFFPGRRCDECTPGARNRDARQWFDLARRFEEIHMASPFLLPDSGSPSMSSTHEVCSRERDIVLCLGYGNLCSMIGPL